MTLPDFLVRWRYAVPLRRRERRLAACADGSAELTPPASRPNINAVSTAITTTVARRRSGCAFIAALLFPGATARGRRLHIHTAAVHTLVFFAVTPGLMESPPETGRGLTAWKCAEQSSESVSRPQR